jgi:biotin carboxyl carrier protein
MCILICRFNFNQLKNSDKMKNKKETPEYIDFAVTARKYKTLLTRKYQNRKVWVNPNPYEIQSFIPGTILQISVKEGEVVNEGAPLLILEAMKMQNRIEMPFTAKIKKINVNVGDRVPKDTLMIELEAVEGE